MFALRRRHARRWNLRIFMNRHRSPELIRLWLFTAIAAPLAAQAQPEVAALRDLDFEQLANVRVTLVSREAESAFAASAAVYVLTADDIRRSGLRRLPELLRMVPGLHVGAWDSNKWGIASRNGMRRFASTMQVMIDGRMVYTPLFGGVRWEIQDYPIEDIERIEVIRGPGASLWGVNAVDGIISIVTRNARDTRGSQLTASAGTAGSTTRRELGARHGDRTTDGKHYRVFARGWESGVGEYPPAAQSTHGGRLAEGSTANDVGASGMAGFRMDWQASARDRLALLGNAFRSRFDEDRGLSSGVLQNQVNYSGANALAEWQRDLGGDQSLQLRGYVDRVRLDDDILSEDQTILDLDAQHSLLLGRHQVLWGLGLRYYLSDTRIPDIGECNSCFGLLPRRDSNTILSGFVQDRFALAPELSLSLGVKFETSGYSGAVAQPTARLTWTPDSHQTLWASATRSARTPTRAERDSAFYNVAPTAAPFLPCQTYVDNVCQIGNRDAEPWRVNTYEAGYRWLATDWLGIDLAAFLSDYHDTLDLTSTRGLDEVKGFETVVRLRPSNDWRIETSWTRHDGRDALTTGGTVPLFLLPRSSAHLRSFYNLTPNVDFDVLVYYSDAVRRNTLTLPAYTRLDMRLEWRVGRRLAWSLLLSNLLDDAHPEYMEPLKVNTSARRAAMLTLTFTPDRALD